MFKLEETGWSTNDMTTTRSNIVLLDDPLPLNDLIVHMLANSCGGSSYRFKNGVAKSMDLDDRSYNHSEWKKEWIEEKHWKEAVLYHFDNSHNDPSILVQFHWTGDPDEPDLSGGAIVGYGFNYC